MRYRWSGEADVAGTVVRPEAGSIARAALYANAMAERRRDCGGGVGVSKSRITFAGMGGFNLNRWPTGGSARS